MKPAILISLFLLCSAITEIFPQKSHSIEFGYNNNINTANFNRQLIYWDLGSIYNFRAGYNLEEKLYLTFNFGYAKMPFKGITVDLVIPAYVGAPIPVEKGEAANIILSGLGLKYYYTSNNIFSQYFILESGLLFVDEGEVSVEYFYAHDQTLDKNPIKGTGESYTLYYGVVGMGLSFDINGILFLEAGASVLMDFNGELFSIPVGISVGTRLL
ncbi:MAG: hypothetical protein Kow0098_05920 [Ignavibacteriaceae bacterium]